MVYDALKIDPFDVIEEQVMAGFLLASYAGDADIVRETIDALPPEAFQVPRLRALFKKLAAGANPTDLQDEIKGVGGLNHLRRNIGTQYGDVFWEARARLQERHRDRTIRTLGKQLAQHPLSLDEALEALGRLRTNGSGPVSATAWSYSVYRVDEFLARPQPAVTSRVEGIVREGSICILYGGPGRYKTTFACQLGRDIAQGDLFLGRFPTVAGPVLFAQEDMHDADFHALLTRLRVRAGAPFFVAPQQGLKLDNAERWRAFCARVEEVRPAVAFLDAWYVLHDTEGFTGKELAPLLDRLRRLRNDYKLTVFFIDHPRKESGPARGRGGDPLDQLYGGRAKSAGADMVLYLQGVRDADRSVILSMQKQRGAALLQPLRLEFTEEEGLVVLGDAAQPLRASETVILRWLAGRGDGATRKEIVEGTRLSDRTVKGTLPLLRAQGKIEVLDRRGRADVWATPENAAQFRSRHGILPEMDTRAEETP